ENLPGGQPLQVLVLELPEGLERLARIVNQPPNQGLFRLFQLPERRKLPGGDGGAPVDRRLTNLRANDLFCDTSLVSYPIRELISCRRIRYPSGHRQHLAQKLSPTVIVSEIHPRGCLIQQVFEIRPRRT